MEDENSDIQEPYFFDYESEYKEWKEKYRIKNLEQAFKWFGERKYWYYYFLLMDYPPTRTSLNEIKPILKEEKSASLYREVLRIFGKVMTKAEYAMYDTQRYRLWKKEMGVKSLEDLCEMVYITFEDENGEYLGEVNLESEFTLRDILRIMNEMPGNRKSVDEILRYIERIDFDEVFEMLLTRFREFLTPEEIESFTEHLSR